MNDRALRQVVVGLGGKVNGFVREDGFMITVASEVMAILCLADDIEDLRRRLGNIIVAYNYDGAPVISKGFKGGWRDDVIVKGCNPAESRPDVGEYTVSDAWRSVCQYCARL